MKARLGIAGAIAAGLLAACAGGPGHPVRGSLPRLAVGETFTAPTGIYEPDAPSAADAASLLFHRLEGVLRPLEQLHRKPVPDPRKPIVAALPRMEAAVIARYRGGGFGGPVHNAVAVSATGIVPLAPRDAAKLWMDTETERRVLKADTFRQLDAEYELPGASRLRYLVEMRRVGKGPLRFNLRFGLAAEYWEVPDGRILLRYDPRPELRPEHVTLYRGGCLIEPTEQGSRVTELLILGTDIRVPFFLQKDLRKETRNKLMKRARGLWAKAWEGR